MDSSLKRELRYLLPAWIGCILLPLPAIVFWRSNDGRSMALSLFFVACAGLVAYAFRRDLNAASMDDAERLSHTWNWRMGVLGVALLSAAVVFSLLCLILNDPSDLVLVILAGLIPIPSLCIAPYLTLATRKPFAAVVFTVALVACMKLLGCVVVVLVYGWYASEQGHTTMPWTRPNLLVWLFWLNTAVLSTIFYFQGKWRYQGRLAHAS